VSSRVGNVVVESLGAALPRSSTSARSLVAGCRTPIAFEMEAITGITSTPTAGDGEYALDMAQMAIRDCLSRSQYGINDIDVVISGSLLNCNTPGVVTLEPGMASSIKQRMGFENAMSLDVSSACAGVFVGLWIAESFLKSGAARRVLLFSGEFVTHAARTAQAQVESANDPRMPCLTVGDSGIALLLELGDRSDVGFTDLRLFTLGRYSGHCVAKPTERAPGGVLMKTDTVRLALITSKEGMRHFERMQEERGTAAEFDFFVPHQASSATLAGVIRDANKRAGSALLNDGNVVNNLALRGNTVTTTHFLAIYDAIKSARIRTGHRLLLSTVASGVTIGSAAYHLDELPLRLNAAPTRAEANPSPSPEISSFFRPLAVRVKLGTLGFATESTGIAPATLNLAKNAVRACLAQEGVERNLIELLLFAGVYRSEFVIEPAIAAFLAGELRINDSSRDAERRTLAFDVNDGANGFLSACHVAARALAHGAIATALVVVAEGEVPYEVGAPHVTPSASAALLRVSNDETGFSAFGCYEFSALSHLATSSVLLKPEGGAVLDRRLVPEYARERDRAVVLALEQYLLAQPGLVERLDYLVFSEFDSAFERALADRLRLPARCQLSTAPAALEWFTSALPRRLGELQALRPEELRGKHAVFVSSGAGFKVACATYQF
jgi:3-oxoacyl-[acyl-carrier-protein] synthase III